VRTVNRFEVANLICLGLLVAAAAAVAVGAGWWAVGLAASGAFVVGGWVVERLAPGTRLLDWLGLGWRDPAEPPTAPDRAFRSGSE
jgi:hypothetical protein